MSKLLKTTIPILLILGLILAPGCASSSSPAPIPPQGMPKEAPSVDEGSFRSSGGEDVGTSVDRKVIKTGHLTLEVDDIADAMDDVTRIARDLNGYVVSSNKYGSEDRIFGRVSIRVPAERFEDAFNLLRQIAIDVPYENTDSQDITEEYTDLEAQLHNLEATEAQYLALLEKAETVEDILKVQQALSNVRGEIERIKGRMLYLERTSDMALIEASLQETKPIGSIGWSASGVFKSAINGLITLGKVLANIAIWLAIFCPIWIPIIFLVRYLRRRRQKVKA